MKRIWMILMLILILTVSGCSHSAKNPTSDNKGENDSDSSWIKEVVFQEPDQRNVQSNLIAEGGVEDDHMIIFDYYTYNKKTGEVSLLCKNPVCSHNSKECPLNEHYCFQIYKDNILCCEGNHIYTMDSETGELSQMYETDMEKMSFRMIGEDTALIHCAKGFFVMNFKTGKKHKILDGDIYNAFYTNDNEYLYISMENSELHRVRLDGTEDKVLMEKTAWPIIYEDRIFYGYWRDEEWSLKSINKDGGDDKMILDDMSTYSIYGGKIYYFTASYPRKAIMCDIDGQNKKELFNGDGSFSIFPQSRKVIASISTDQGMEYKIMGLDGSDVKDLEIPDWE